MWLNKEARIAQIANINLMNTSSFLRVELSTLIGEKSLTLVGLEPATFRLQASTLTSRPLVTPLTCVWNLIFLLVNSFITTGVYSSVSSFNIIPPSVNAIMAVLL